MSRPAASGAARCGRASRRFLALAAAALIAAPAAAQQLLPPETPPLPRNAALFADRVEIDESGRLIAIGNVEMLVGEIRLVAHSLEYSTETDTLSIVGPITIHGEGVATVVAESGELDRSLRAGALRQARIIVNDHVQFAARTLDREAGRYSHAVRVSATSCRICEGGGPPLWEIRARHIVHDEQERQFHIDRAQLRILGLPVAAIPRLRLADPSVRRATGFLVPSLHNSSVLGVGAKTPYFVEIGESADVTFTPFVTDQTRTMELRYRQAFRSGNTKLEGAFSNDEYAHRRDRGYLFGEGAFALPADYRLNLEGRAVSDDAYLFEHGYSDLDRLKSGAAIERPKRNELSRASLEHYHSLRRGEETATLPALVADGTYELRRLDAAAGGELRLSAQMHAHLRPSDNTTDGPDADPWADGRDVARIGFGADWRRSWTALGAVRAQTEARLHLDSFSVADAGETSERAAAQATPAAALELRAPFVRAGQRGAAQLLEPVLRLDWTGGKNLRVPNDESTQIEFDEGNLFAPSRFSAPDRRERGLAAAYGVGWQNSGPSGARTSLAVGQILREREQLDADGRPSLPEASGISGTRSALLVAAQAATPGGLLATARTLLASNLDPNRAEARAGYESENVSLSWAYAWLETSEEAGPEGEVSEWATAGSYRLSNHWTAGGNWRYDTAANRSVRGGLEFTYENECAEIRMSAERKFTSPAQQTSSTEFSFTVGLRGFSLNAGGRNLVRGCGKK